MGDIPYPSPLKSEEGDILIIKDDSPGTVAGVLRPLLRFFDEYETVGEHDYIIRLKTGHKELASFIAAFLNSEIGQALVRRYITGAIGPSISERHIESLPIVLPPDEIFKEAKEKLEDLQKTVIEMMHPTRYPRNCWKKLTLKTIYSSSCR